MFKVNYVNGDYIDSTVSPASVLGTACHKALAEYFINWEKNMALPTMRGQEAGIDYLENGLYSGLVEFNDKYKSMEDIKEKFAFCYFGYLKAYAYQKDIKEVLFVERKMTHTINVEGKNLPVPLKGIADLCYRDKKGKLKLIDHKFTAAWSPEDKIDGGKLLQAVFNYFLIYAETGEAPYSMTFAEFKTSENKKDPTASQIKSYEMVFEDHPLMFDFFYRMYEDVTSALTGKMVFVPNISAFYDNEVSILSYIHRLDVDEDRDKAFKKLNVNNMTDFLKKKLQTDGAMKKYLETVSDKFISGKTLDYKNMKIEDKIRMKLAEHGLGIQFEDKIVGGAVTLYRYEPSIGLKMSRIEGFVKDIEQVVGVSGIRVLAPIKNSNLVGFEVPNAERTFYSLPNTAGDYNLVIGKDIMGKDFVFDIRQAPHMLVAGSTGSGKSVFLNSIINQLMKIEDAELHLFDPKQVELIEFQGKDKVAEYRTEKQDILLALQILVQEMQNRYTAFTKVKAKDISGITGIKRKFVVFDEFADVVSDKDIMTAVDYLARKGRAAGIHLIFATQRASSKLLGGDLKVNFPTKAVFRMAKTTDSNVMLDTGGAEKLLGKGDMLFSSDLGLERLQGYSIK